jgi:membrane fusion protein (multidrug efflux system)
MRNAMRYVIAIVCVLLLVGGLALIKYKQIKQLIGFGEQMASAGPPPTPVGSFVATEETWEDTISTFGTVASVNGVAISAEAPGTVSKIFFDSGALVKQGDVLVELDSSVERAQLAAAYVRNDLATSTAGRSQALGAAGVVSSAQVDVDSSQARSALAEIALVEAQIAKKKIRAPFAGRLGIRSVNVGQYVNPGTALVMLEAVAGVFVDFTLPQQEPVAAGLKVRVAVAGVAGLAAEGVIAAVEPTVDAATRTQKIRATLPNPDAKLRPGMFADVVIVLPNATKRVVVPVTAILHAAYGDSLFILDPAEGEPPADGPPPKTARQAFVRIGPAQGDFVSVLEGLKPGEEVVSSGAFKLRNQVPVVVDNSVAPKLEHAPTPENR